MNVIFEANEEALDRLRIVNVAYTRTPEEASAMFEVAEQYLDRYSKKMPMTAVMFAKYYCGSVGNA